VKLPCRQKSDSVVLDSQDCRRESRQQKKLTPATRNASRILLSMRSLLKDVADSDEATAQKIIKFVLGPSRRDGKIVFILDYEKANPPQLQKEQF
jgi:hypothetical protein